MITLGCPLYKILVWEFITLFLNIFYSLFHGIFTAYALFIPDKEQGPYETPDGMQTIMVGIIYNWFIFLTIMSLFVIC